MLQLYYLEAPIPNMLAQSVSVRRMARSCVATGAHNSIHCNLIGYVINGFVHVACVLMKI